MVRVRNAQNIIPILGLKRLAPYTSGHMFYSTRPNQKLEYKKCYNILNVPENSDQETIRRAYLELVKRYHPDSATDEADVKKFQEIDRAFKILMDKKAKERWQVSDEHVEDETPQHATPQHRHFLGFDGIGHGTIFQREKQYAQSRAMRASDSVLNHRIQKATVDDKSLVEPKRQKHNIKTKYGFDRLVEDLIQEAMSKGQFDNLSGTGKPLREAKGQSPYIDFITHKLNEVLIENGFTPEWITLQKEIRDETQLIKNALCLERKRFPPHPLVDEHASLWDSVVEHHKKMADELNRKIKKYNLLVPMLSRQMFLMNLRKEAHKILVKGKSNKDVEYVKKINASSEPKEEKNGLIHGLLQLWFKG
uniref:J domain-containing protein n=2 Tax=Photinus pyralis TaxID=7054 RepID=A0A1Y1KDU0_PHOPY